MALKNLENRLFIITLWLFVLSTLKITVSTVRLPQESLVPRDGGARMEKHKQV